MVTPKVVDKIDRKTINVIRTMQRNNIDLKNIADNKANILLSLNALMLTILIPIILSYHEIIRAEHLYIPLAILFITCFSTMVIAANVLKPFNWVKVGEHEKDIVTSSPFFFINYYRKDIDEFMDQIDECLVDSKKFKEYVIADLFLIGKVLGAKYTQINISYNVFLAGVSLTIISSVIVVFI